MAITLEQLLAESIEAQRIATEIPRWATIAQFAHYSIRRCDCGTEAGVFEGFYLYQKLGLGAGRGFRLVAAPEADAEHTCEAYTTLRKVGYCSECLAEVDLDETDPDSWPLLKELGEQYSEPEAEDPLDQEDIFRELEEIAGITVIPMTSPESVMQVHGTLQNLLGE